MEGRPEEGDRSVGDRGPRSGSQAARKRLAPLLTLFFLSGAAALVYEVLWMKELGLLFGATAYAAAATLAVFFLGLAWGSWYWGRRAARLRHPLRTWAWLELAIAGSASLYFGLLPAYHWLYPYVFAALEGERWAFLSAKVALATVILLPPAFFMGGTLPVMGQYLVRRSSELGRLASLLYWLNTLGAAAGAFLAGFVLPATLGFRLSFACAMATNVAIGGMALWWVGRARLPRPAAETPASSRPASSEEAISLPLFWLLAIASGFLTLGLEVLWTRMFAQTLQNSVYTFAAILTVFLLALALGSALAHALCRRRARPIRSMTLLLSLAGLAVGASPLLFYRLTSGLELIAPHSGWSAYVAAVFGTIVGITLVPGILVGGVFPYLLKLAEERMTTAGATIGRLAAANTVAAVFGSLAAGFVLLSWLGLWESLRLVAACYLLLALAVLARHRRAVPPALGIVPALGLAALYLWAPFHELRDLTLDRAEREALVAVRQGVHGTVAVVRHDGKLRLKVNNHYHLGGSHATLNQRLQAWIPMSLHPDPRSVFFLGMGTGITAGGALDFPVERVVVTELIPDVVALDREHFGGEANGLFADPRVSVRVEDGRNYLAGTRERFDVVIGDIFLPYRAGVGALYTKEHFENVRRRLAPGGIFAQWLAIFDFSERDFGIVARTMAEVFPQVTIWRRGFSPTFSIFALVGSEAEAPLDVEALRAHAARLAAQPEVPDRLWFTSLPLAAYVGNLRALERELAERPVATDDLPLLEYLAPKTDRQGHARRVALLAWQPLAELCERMLRQLPPGEDRYLANASPVERGHVLAGLARQRMEVYRRLGDAEGAREQQRIFDALVTAAGERTSASEGDGRAGEPD